ncbi:hypothetical protein R1flu_009316 [Riccia fluitans]|uniref:Uncharacterized protein n=1 Tax=Riccia fluitans TaxID=41844 RepID=A0ABD1Z1R0_9MARC
MTRTREAGPSNGRPKLPIPALVLHRGTTPKRDRAANDEHRGFIRSRGSIDSGVPLDPRRKEETRGGQVGTTRNPHGISGRCTLNFSKHRLGQPTFNSGLNRGPIGLCYKIRRGVTCLNLVVHGALGAGSLRDLVQRATPWSTAVRPQGASVNDRRDSGSSPGQLEQVGPREEICRTWWTLLERHSADLSSPFDVSE